MSNIQQTPLSFLDYVIDWPSLGLPSGATISTSTYATSDPSVVVSNDSIITNGTQTQFWVTGGLAGNVYTINNTIILSTTQEMQCTIKFSCVAEMP